MRRIVSLDVVRGAAVCGILFVNVPPLLHMIPGDGNGPNTVRHFLDLFVQQRFFPIFSLLFGVGFGIMWGSARARAAHPRVVMLRRIVALLLLGIPHAFLHPGEALFPYAVCALVFLLPMTVVPQRAMAPTAAVLGAGLLAGGIWIGGGLGLLPGLFLLGFAIGRTDLPRRVENSPRVVIGATVALVALAVPALWWQEHSQGGWARDAGGAAVVAGLILALTYVGVLLSSFHTPLRSTVVLMFAPLGRTALTTYVSATLAVIAIRPLIPQGWGDQTRDWAVAMAACVALLAVQWVFARWVLTRFGQGPLERLWRIATWHGARLTPSATAPAAVAP